MRLYPDPNGPSAEVQLTVEVAIHNYEVFLEKSTEAKGKKFSSTIHVTFRPRKPPSLFLTSLWRSATSLIEVLAREEGFNLTAIESCFVLTKGHCRASSCPSAYVVGRMTIYTDNCSRRNLWFV